uniref:Uncharacterized protein n=1 Tax=Chromera velia CCMP2878 TaxID=1169474 RepID=A0A0G4HXD6_9ALVE|eukprot:Cvel_9256.t1-p1 / transcript=Cvel_9256.t1 / gene=Cvel_9256 / organism=Chromera_velia_CCMP2878 / gene_product=hypothetical protein / transcript_product=hypothetical protein / location=Cvel_scaffold529:23593-34239(-) / protein_length=1141 / sequence_SO=supercontig / SO=protein_coding / is_pseudo=false
MRRDVGREVEEAGSVCSRLYANLDIGSTSLHLALCVSPKAFSGSSVRDSSMTPICSHRCVGSHECTVVLEADSRRKPRPPDCRNADETVRREGAVKSGHFRGGSVAQRASGGRQRNVATTRRLPQVFLRQKKNGTLLAGRIGELGTRRASGAEGSSEHLEEAFSRPIIMRKDDICTDLFTQEAQSPSDAFLNVYASPEEARVSMGGSEAEGGCRSGAGCRAGAGCRVGAGCRARAGCRAGAGCGVGAGCRARVGCRARAGCRAGAGCRARVGCRARPRIDTTSTGLEQRLGGRDDCDANRASKLENAHYRDAVRGGEPFEDTSFVAAEWALSNRARNRLAHAYHGNRMSLPFEILDKLAGVGWPTDSGDVQGLADSIMGCDTKGGLRQRVPQLSDAEAGRVWGWAKRISQPTAPAQGRPEKRARTESQIFSLEWLESLERSETSPWIDYSWEIPFMGRTAFSLEVAKILDRLWNEHPRGASNTVALVYSSVNGTGKTVSMLHLKNRLKNDLSSAAKNSFVVAYLGFGCDLKFSEVERGEIRGGDDQEMVAKKVLARRLLGAAVLSKRFGEAITQLPNFDEVYAGRNFPEVAECREMICSFFKASRQNPVAIVAGVNEVQLLDQTRLKMGDYEHGLGMLFLRWLREWQSEWWASGIRLLPLGTGVLLEFPAMPWIGRNIALKADSDAVLISKVDFKKLVCETLQNPKFEKQKADLGRVSIDAAADLMTAVWYPRVRLLQRWRSGKQLFVVKDSNASMWTFWMRKWMLGESLSIRQPEKLPGYPSGVLTALFMDASPRRPSEVQVIPDGYSAHSIIDRLKADLPVGFLYRDLERYVPSSMDPSGFVLTDERAFEHLGFSVLGTAIHFGMHALTDAESVAELPEKRVGLALWFLRQGCSNGTPKVFGLGELQEKGPFYPFYSNDRLKFCDEFVEAAASAVSKREPLFIRGGKQSPCDYVYCYRVSPDGWAAMVVDAKHTSEASGGAAVTTGDQNQMWSALSGRDSNEAGKKGRGENDDVINHAAMAAATAISNTLIPKFTEITTALESLHSSAISSDKAVTLIGQAKQRIEVRLDQIEMIVEEERVLALLEWVEKEKSLDHAKRGTVVVRHLLFGLCFTRDDLKAAESFSALIECKWKRLRKFP